MGAESSFLSRAEVLGGLPAKRARTLLFAIENRTAQLVARSRSALQAYQSDLTASERERAFLDAVSAGREPSVRPAITDVERYAPDWARLVPDDPDLRAHLARLLGSTHRFTRPLAPRIIAALGLDDERVRDAFQRAHGAGVETVFATNLPPRERFAWARARYAERLETLPPFWTVFALTLTETVGAGILGIPIALATLGPLGAVVLLAVMGAINLITIAALSEAFTRTGSMRYGGFFGRLIGDYLHRPGTIAMTISLGVYNVLMLLILFLGFGSVLGAQVGMSPVGGVAVLLIIVAAFLVRGSIGATVASALVIGALNLFVLGFIAVIALLRSDMGTLFEVPILSADSVGVVGPLGVAIAVALTSYHGHTSAANAATLVLRRDPSGRSLLWGNLCAMTAVIVVYALIGVAIIGAVGPDALLGYEGTALELLAERLGPAIGVLGVLYAALAMGLGSVHAGLGLANQAREVLGTDSATGWVTRVAPRVAAQLRSPAGRVAVRLAPTIVTVAMLEVMLVTGASSFTGLLALIGALIVPLLGGAFPMMLLAASRNAGEYVPDAVIRFIGHPVVVIAVTVLYLAVVLAHGLFVMETLPERLVAFAVAAAIIALIAVSLVRGAFGKRAVVEMRIAEGGKGEGTFSVISQGHPVAVPVTVDTNGTSRSITAAAGQVGRLIDLRRLTLVLPDKLAPQMKIWLHGVTADSESLSLPGVTAEIDGVSVALNADGQAVVALSGKETVVTISV